MARYANAPGTSGMIDGIATITRGTLRHFDKLKLAVEANKEPRKELTITLNPSSVERPENFINPAMNPAIQIAINERNGVLNKTPKPSAAQPHQNARVNMVNQSIIQRG